jgi:hypothetical protein
MAWPGTENVGFGTVGVGRGCVDVTSRKVESCLDMFEVIMVRFLEESCTTTCRLKCIADEILSKYVISHSQQLAEV